MIFLGRFFYKKMNIFGELYGCRMLGRLREGAKAPQASQARASSPLRGAPFCAGFARVKASPFWGGGRACEAGGALPAPHCEGLSPLSTSFSTCVLNTLIFPQTTTGYTGGAKALLQTISRRKYRVAPLLIHIFHRKTGFPPFPGVFPVENS